MIFFGSNPGHPGEDPFWTMGQLFEQTSLSATRQCYISKFQEGHPRYIFCEIILNLGEDVV